MAWTLYYDGECNLCHGSQLTVVRWAARAGQDIRTELLQSDEAVAKGYDSDTMVLEADTTYFAEDAWLRLMRIAPWYSRWIGYVGQWPGVHAIMRLGYRTVARYRKRWFGQRACPLPPPGGVNS